MGIDCIQMDNIADHRVVRSVSDVRGEFELRGLSIAGWARTHGYSAQLVYRILAGKISGRRGQSHEIAVRLGLKRGLAGSIQDLEDALKQSRPMGTQSHGLASTDHGGGT